MPLPVQQLKGNIKFGILTANLDFSNFVTSLTIHRTRESITVPATFGTGRATQVAGALGETLEINFFSGTDAASMWALVYDIMDTDSSELKWEATLNTGIVSADNPKFSGTITILALDSGGTVGSLRQQTQTYPITAAGITKVIV